MLIEATDHLLGPFDARPVSHVKFSFFIGSQVAILYKFTTGHGSQDPAVGTTYGPMGGE